MAKIIKSCLVWDERYRPDFNQLLELIDKMENEKFLQVIPVVPELDDIHMPKQIDCVFMLDCTGYKNY